MNMICTMKTIFDSSYSSLPNLSCISASDKLSPLFISLFFNSSLSTFRNIVTNFVSFPNFFIKFSVPFTSISFTIIFPLSIFSFINFFEVP